MLLEFIKSGTWQNRSALIYGPFNLVYGLGAVLFMISLYRVRNLWVVFILGTFLGGFFEYMISWLQEIIFHTTSWDYSNHFLNINGRTTIPFAIVWGILCVLMIKIVLPYLSKLIEKVPNKVGYPLTWVMVIFMVYNLSISSLAANRNLERHKGIPANSEIDRVLDKHFPDEKMREIYDNFEFTN